MPQFRMPVIPRPSFDFGGLLDRGWDGFKAGVELPDQLAWMLLTGSWPEEDLDSSIEELRKTLPGMGGGGRPMAGANWAHRPDRLPFRRMTNEDLQEMAQRASGHRLQGIDHVFANPDRGLSRDTMRRVPEMDREIQQRLGRIAQMRPADRELEGNDNLLRLMDNLHPRGGRDTWDSYQWGNITNPIPHYKRGARYGMGLLPSKGMNARSMGALDSVLGRKQSRVQRARWLGQARGERFAGGHGGKPLTAVNPGIQADREHHSQKQKRDDKGRFKPRILPKATSSKRPDEGTRGPHTISRHNVPLITLNARWRVNRGVKM